MRLLLVAFLLLFQSIALPAKPTTPAAESGVSCLAPSNSPNAKEDLLYRAYLWFTVIGVIGAWCGMGIIYLQTKAAREATVAARRSADALISIERPWIQVVVSQPNENDPSLLQFDMVNKGKTPAQIVSHTIRRDRKMNADQLPAAPNYGAFEHTEAINLLPSSELRRIGRFTISEEMKLHEETRVDVGKGMMLIFYGIVRYKNVIDAPLSVHETRFCYCYAPMFHNGSPFACGPEQYNIYT